MELMEGTEVVPMPASDLQRSKLRRPLARCPACASASLQPVVEADADEVHFLCVDCSRCWHVELGYVQRMTPATCFDCPQAARCAAVPVADHASD